MDRRKENGDSVQKINNLERKTPCFEKSARTRNGRKTYAAGAEQNTKGNRDMSQKFCELQLDQKKKSAVCRKVRLKESPEQKQT